MFQIRNLKKNYITKKGIKHQALNGIDLDFGNRGFVVVLGKSGSGKSTLMNILGGLDQFDDGEIIIKDKSSSDFSIQDWDSYRNTYVGFVFQEFYIIEEFNIGKNIAFALELQGYSKSDVEKKVDEILETVELKGYANRKPNEISGGQKQRIAIARALIKDPEIILADEPTGNLDSETGKNIMKILKNLSKDKLVVMVTHDRDFALQYADRIIELKDGQVISDEINIIEDESEIKSIDLDGPIGKVIKLPAGRPLNESAISVINDILCKSSNDYYLSLSDNETYISDLAPDFISNLRSDNPKINKNDYRYLYRDTSNSKFKLIKSNFAFTDALKMAFSSLFRKKIRLILMTFLFLVSLTFFGLAINFARYNVDKASVITFKEQSIENFRISKYYEKCWEDGGCYSQNTTSSLDDVNYLIENYQNLSFYPVERFTFDISNFNTDNKNDPVFDGMYFDKNINSVVYIDNTVKFKLLGNSKIPEKDNEILISDYLAEMFIYYNIFPEVQSSEELINTELTSGNVTLKISGIIDTAFTKDMVENKENQGYLYQVFTEDFLTIYCLKSCEDNIIKFKSTLGLRTNINNGWVEIESYSNFRSDNVTINGEIPSSNDEILVSEQYALNYLASNDLGDNIDQIIGKTVTYNFLKGDYDSEKENEAFLKTYKIVGVFNFNHTGEENKEYINDFALYVSDEEFKNLYQEIKIIDSILVNLSDNIRDNNKFITDLSKLKYKHNTSFSRMIYQIESISKEGKKGLFITASVFGVFASVMIFTFISNSINSKRKEIGTLRAIGSSGFNVAKIFVTESVIIGLFTSVLALIAVQILSNIIEGDLQRALDSKMTLLYTDIVGILYLFLLAVGIVFISSFIPVRRISREKPIDAIKLK